MQDPWLRPWARLRARYGGRAKAGEGGASPRSLQSIGSLLIVPAPGRSRRRGGPRQAGGVGLSCGRREVSERGVAGG